MARRDETVWAAIFDDLLAGGLCQGTIKLNGAPVYVFQVRANPPQRWHGVIMRRNAEALWSGDSAESVKFMVQNSCRTRVTEWAEGYWYDDTWQPKTARPAYIPKTSPPDPETAPVMEVIRGGKQKGAKV